MSLLYHTNYFHLIVIIFWPYWSQILYFYNPLHLFDTFSYFADWMLLQSQYSLFLD